MNLWSVEHFLNIKIRFSCNQNIGETLFYIDWVSLQCFDYLLENLILMKEMLNWSEIHS